MTLTITPTATSTGLEVTPLSGTIGAEIRGVDLKQPLDDATVDAIRSQLLRYHVIFFPGQHLSPDEHVAFGRYFGELTPAHPVIPSVDGYPELFEIDYQRTAQPASDLRRRGAPVRRALVAHRRHVRGTPAARFDPQRGRHPTERAATRCSPTSRRRTPTSARRCATSSTASPRCTTAAERSRRTSAIPTRPTWSGKAELYTAIQPVEHPVVRTHPETGAKVLFVNPGFTSHIKGLTPAESDALLAFLYAHATKAKYTVRYHWQAGDLGFWDNRVTQHSVVGDFADQHRVIQRVTIRGDKPV